MPRSLRTKFIAIVLVVLGCVTGVVGIPTSVEELKAAWSRNIRLGLDLKGGSHLTLQIQAQDAFKTAADQLMETLKARLTQGNVPFTSMERNDPATLEEAGTIHIDVKGVPPARAGDFSRIVNDAAAGEWTAASAGDNAYRLTMTKSAMLRLHEETLTQSIQTIDRKVNSLGVAEASVQRRGGTGGRAEILVQLPGVDDPARVRGIIQTAAMLELSEVKDGPFPSRDAALSRHGGALPLNTKLVRGQSPGGEGEVWWLLARSPVVTGRDLRDARPQQNETGGWDTSFVLNQEAAGRFGKYTESNIGNRLAIVLDNTVISAPRIDSKISDQGRIMGAADHQEAGDLALNLRAGSLPAGLKILADRFVGPSLGADSIRRGVTAGITGLALVIASMILYYRGAGVNAVIALLLNTIITVAALSYIEAAWTLPGIAGLVLSIGMAVDSNVLIFERIKEELRAGKGVYAAIAAGFDRAFVTIIDTHVTTVVASAFLFIFGTGPVRGFAVTLAIGLAANLFTAVFVSRAIFEWQMWRRPKAAALSIGAVRADAGRTFDFLGKRNLALAISAALVLISIASLVMKGGPKYGLDFRGGTLIYAKAEPRPSMDDLRQVLSAGLAGEVSVQEDRGTGEFIIGTELADEQSLQATRQKVEDTLRSKYKSVDIRSAEMVGPKAGAQLQQQAIYATLGALAGMLAYIAYRFELISGVAAVIATLHDVVITVGLFSLTDREINLNIIAALLTLIGYSMNDKIVVFDRVRENMQAKRRGMSFFDLVNLSINQTLSRTMLTAGPTLLACLALYFLGGEVLNGIAFALFAGIVVGTWSSIFVASVLLVMWHEHRTRRPLQPRTAQ